MCDVLLVVEELLIPSYSTIFYCEKEIANTKMA
jgi:hypothetical protein